MCVRIPLSYIVFAIEYVVFAGRQVPGSAMLSLYIQFTAGGKDNTYINEGGAIRGFTLMLNK